MWGSNPNPNMLVNCAHCKTPLALPPGAQSIRCAICQRVTHVAPAPVTPGPVPGTTPVADSNRNPNPQIYAPHPPNAHGNKKAVIIGVSYRYTQHELKGCLNDAKCMNYLLVNKFQFPQSSIVLLTEDQTDPVKLPTKHNIKMAMFWLLQGCQPGDSLFFHFSGHGSQQPNRDGGEVDGYDETILPMDFKTHGMLVDDEINMALVRPLPIGVRLHAVVDACHSGTVLDLPFFCRIRSNGQYVWEDHRPRNGIYKGTSGGEAYCFSGCDDNQTSADTSALSKVTYTGAMTFCFIQAIERGQARTYRDLLHSMRYGVQATGTGTSNYGGPLTSIVEMLLTGGSLSGGSLSGGRVQEPQLTASNPFDIARPYNAIPLRSAKAELGQAASANGAGVKSRRDMVYTQQSRDGHTVRQRQPHVVMVPYPLQGHISPLMQLSRVLASKGCRVTFITTQFNINLMEKSCARLRQELPENLHLVGISDDLPAEHDRNPFKPESLTAIVEGGIPSNTAKAITQLASSSNSVTCLIHDSFLLWAHDIATNLKIPRVPFWPNSITCFACSYYADKIAAAVPGLDPFDYKTYRQPNADVRLDGIVPGVPSIRAGDLPLSMLDPSLAYWMRDQVAQQKAAWESAHAVIINSSPELETFDAAAASTFYNDLTANLPVKLNPVGPLFEACRDLAGTDVSLWEREDECLQWLDEQGAGSVVYMSLGSVAFVAEEELREMGKGLAASGKAFLWVFKTWASEKSVEEILGDDVMQMVKDGRGKIVKWAPQKEVLAHEAVGAFVSHCGWNSTLESLRYGVPMLGLPLMMDQLTNCWVVNEQRNHGFRLYPDKEGGLARSIETGIKCAMGSGNPRRGLVARDCLGALDALVESILKL